ncbi:hypothetical protein ACWEQC_43945 [Streptomyces shenzhenensis]
MDIRWDNLGEVSLASFGVTIAVVVLFSLAIAAWKVRWAGGSTIGSAAA